MEQVIKWMESHAGTASWAQAIGTVIALAIAVAIPLYQHYMMRRDTEIKSHEHAIQLFDSLGAMANFAGQIFGTLKHDFDEKDVFFAAIGTYEPHTLAVISADFDRYPIYQLPDHDSVSTALEIKAYFARAKAHLERSIQALSDGSVHTFAEEAESFRIMFGHYSEAVESFSMQASEYRERISIG